MLCSGIVFCKSCRERVQRLTHTHTHTPHRQRKWAQALYSRKMHQIVISHFCFLWITKRSQLFPGLPSGVGGGEEG